MFHLPMVVPTGGLAITGGARTAPTAAASTPAGTTLTATVTAR
jgi:hypothetical protein